MGIGDILHDITFRLTHTISRKEALKRHNAFVSSRIEDGHPLKKEIFTDADMKVLRKWCYDDYTLDGELYLKARRIHDEANQGL
jgi:hypothetical protein